MVAKRNRHRRTVVTRSEIPGRIRFEAASLRSNPTLARAIDSALTARPDVEAVTANPVSGTVLVHTTGTADTDALAEVIAATIEATIAAGCDGTIAWPPAGAAVALPRRPLTRVLKVAIPQPRSLAVPATLTVSAHGLNMLQNLTLIANVTVASGGESQILRYLGITSIRSQLRFLTGASLALTLGEVWAHHRRGKAWQRASLEAEHQLRSSLFAHMQHQDLAFFDDHGTGSLINAMTDQVARIGALILGGDQLVESAMMTSLASVALVRTSPRLALIAAASLPVGLIPARLLGDRAERSFAKVSAPSAGLTQGLENVLTGIVEVKSFTAESRETARVEEKSGLVASSLDDAHSAALLQNAVVRDVLYLAAAAMFWQAARQVLARKVPIPKLTRAVYWVPQLVGAIGAASQSAATYYGATAAARRLTPILEATPQIRQGSRRLVPGGVRGAITVDHLTFGYAPGRPVLRDISFDLAAGATLGIVGPTGSGKSTLLRLLLRFYEPDQGSIRLDGHDIRDLNTTDLRNAIALVSQEVYLFDDTIAANICYGRPDATADQIGRALASSAATDILEALPGGLDARLGERGHRLSGGQRQRLALARAILKDSPILALDEATSHLDYASEAAIKASLRTIASHKTVLLIAHRLSSVRDADHIIVLDGGAIREQGDHHNLLSQRGLYYHLWELQS